MREGDDDALARADELRELLLGLGKAARRDRRALRLEGERLRLRERVELADAFQVGRLEIILGPHTLDVVGLVHEIGCTVEHRDEIARYGPDLAFLAVPLLDEVEPSLGGGVDRAGLDRVQGPLGEGREGADRLHLVAEEFDAEGLAAGRREDVDEAAANGELPTVVDPLDALVSGEREILREALDALLGTGLQLERSRPRRRRRHALGDRACGGADDPAAGEHLERAGALPDEVGRRLEPRLPGDAAAREVADDLVAEIPRGRLGRVPCVGVLGQQADERPPEALVKCREHHRQRGLGDAGALGQRLREGGEPLVVDELLDEDVEYRAVHDGRRNRAVPRLVMVLTRIAQYSRLPRPEREHSFE